MDAERMQELEALLNKAFSDETSIRALFSAETPEKAHDMLTAKGIKMTLDEVKNLPNVLKMSQGDDELSEDDLEEVAGGITRGGCVIIFPRRPLFPPIIIRPTW